MRKKYWKVVLRYGHVGKRNEISVARFLVTEDLYTPVMVMKEAGQMPGVKHRGVVSIREITEAEFSDGKQLEKENFFLRKMKALREERPA